MKPLPSWLIIILSVATAVLANSVSSIWAKQDDKVNVHLLALLILSPLVFVSFGLATSKVGLSITSGIIDSSLTVCTILVGLLIFQEWNKISFLQYTGMSLALVGMFLMLFFPKT